MFFSFLLISFVALKLRIFIILKFYLTVETHRNILHIQNGHIFVGKTMKMQWRHVQASLDISFKWTLFCFDETYISFAQNMFKRIIPHFTEVQLYRLHHICLNTILLACTKYMESKQNDTCLYQFCYINIWWQNIWIIFIFNLYFYVTSTGTVLQILRVPLSVCIFTWYLGYYYFPYCPGFLFSQQRSRVPPQRPQVLLRWNWWVSFVRRPESLVPFSWNKWSTLCGVASDH